MAEANTSGEIVFAAAKASANYKTATFQGAFIGMAIAAAVYLAIPVQHAIAGLLWTEFISFAALYAILPFLPCRRWIIPSGEMNARVHEAAYMQFFSSGLHKTREANGVEIYLSFFERRVIVIGDAGIHAKMGDQHWQNVRNVIIKGIKGRNARAGICEAIELCGKALTEHFPHQPDDVNELPDQVVDSPLRPDAP
jgi:putative membrane protein